MKVPVPVPSRTLALLLVLLFEMMPFAVARSGWPSPLKSAAVMPTGAMPLR
jgi:hypothetical protein